MSTAVLPPFITTERQALIALAARLQGIDLASGTVTIEGDLANALAVLAAGLVVGAAARFQPGDLSPITLNPLGQVRASLQDEVAPRTIGGPWTGGNPWITG